MNPNDDDLMQRLRERPRPDLPPHLRARIEAAAAYRAPIPWLLPAAAALLGLLHLFAFAAHQPPPSRPRLTDRPGDPAVITNHPTQRHALLKELR